jgi:predicted acylesterase/phospholipase RssA
VLQGAVKYLQEHYSLDQVQLIGCSAGALVAVLLACGVSPDRALRSAFRLSVENDIWSRKGGLAGIWGGLIRAWLDELLPTDAGDRCSGRVRLIATEVPKLGLKYLERFETKQDVIDACSELE